MHPWGFPGGSGVENLPAVQDTRSISGLGRSPGGKHDNPLQYSCLKNPHGQRSLVGYSPWGAKSRTQLKRPSTLAPMYVHTVDYADLNIYIQLADCVQIFAPRQR